MRSVLEEFACGNIDPEVRFVRPGSEYSKAMQRVVDCESELMGVLPESKKDLVNAFIDAQGSVSLLSGTDRFIYGYRLGVLMTMEIFNGMENLLPGGTVL